MNRRSILQTAIAAPVAALGSPSIETVPSKTYGKVAYTINLLDLRFSFNAGKHIDACDMFAEYFVRSKCPRDARVFKKFYHPPINVVTNPFGLVGEMVWAAAPPGQDDVSLLSHYLPQEEFFELMSARLFPTPSHP